MGDSEKTIMSSPPAFQLYASDFYMDTASWSPNEVGIYFRLLMYEWVNGSIPNDNRQMARIAGCDPKTMEKSWVLCTGKKFSQNDSGEWENSRLEQTRKEQQEYREKLANSGRLGGLKTQEKARQESSKASSKRLSENQALQSSSSPSSLKKNKYTVDFQTFYSSYPRKKAPDAAWRAWQKRNGDRPPIEKLLNAIEAQKDSEDWKKDGGQYIPYPATWLNQGCWADEVRIKDENRPYERWFPDETE